MECHNYTSWYETLSEISNSINNNNNFELALAVYTRSPAAYRALQGFGILKLPSKATLQAYTGMKAALLVLLVFISTCMHVMTTC